MAVAARRSPWVLRSMLFVPGDQDRMLRKARGLPADALILDLEDGVAPKDKVIARSRIHHALEEGFPDGLPIFVRPNGLATGMLEDDLLASMHPRLDGVVVPKVRSRAELQLVNGLLSAIEGTRDIPPGHLALAVLVETPQAVLHAEDLVATSSRVVALMFGAEDLAAEMGLSRSAAELHYPRAQTALVAHATGCLAIDLIFPALQDTEGLTRECREGRALGYTGKQVIHPSQLGPVNTAFAPDLAEVAWARKIIDAYRSAPRGALVVEGRMVDAPIVAQAERILADADRIEERARKRTGQ